MTDRPLPGPRKRRPYEWIGADDVRGAERVLDLMEAEPDVAADTEFSLRTNEVAIGSLSAGRGSRYVLHGRHWGPDGVVVRWLQETRFRVWWWNYKADALAMEKFARVRRGAFNRSLKGDGLVTSWCADPNDRVHGLKTDCWRYLEWRRDPYEQFSYTPVGKKKDVVLDPMDLRRGSLPAEALQRVQDALGCDAEAAADWWFDLFCHYNADDSESTWLVVMEGHKPVLQAMDYWDAYFGDERSTTLVIRRQEARGFPIDLAQLYRVERELLTTQLRAQTAFRAIAKNDELNLRSADQMRPVCFDKLKLPAYDDLQTDGGQPSMDEEVRRRWLADGYGHKGVEILNTFAEATKSYGTFAKGIRTAITWDPRSVDGRTLFFDLNQIGTKTGRPSSRKFDVRVKTTVRRAIRRQRVIVGYVEKEVERDVEVGLNILNTPRPASDAYGIRALFVSPAGRKLIVGDYGGFELWALIFWCCVWRINSKMLFHLQRGDDIHMMSAIAVCQLPVKLTGEETKDDWAKYKAAYKHERDNFGKRTNFSLGYGAQVWAFMRIMEWDTRDEELVAKAEFIIRTWNRIWPEMLEYQDYVVDLARKQGWVPTISGLRLPMDRAALLNPEREAAGKRAHAENQAKAMPSATAAAITKRAQILIEYDEELIEYDYQQITNVYDEIVGHVPDGRYVEAARARKEALMRQAARELQEEFIARTKRYDLAVLDFPAEVHTGDNWRDAK